MEAGKRDPKVSFGIFKIAVMLKMLHFQASISRVPSPEDQGEGLGQDLAEGRDERPYRDLRPRLQLRLQDQFRPEQDRLRQGRRRLHVLLQLRRVLARGLGRVVLRRMRHAGQLRNRGRTTGTAAYRGQNKGHFNGRKSNSLHHYIKLSL